MDSEHEPSRLRSQPSTTSRRTGRRGPAPAWQDDETWALRSPARSGPLRVLLAYPSPYSVAAASLGFQTVYRILADLDGLEVDRAWLPEPTVGPAHAREELRGIHTGRPAAEFHLLAISLAYEPELAGLIRLLDAAGLEPLAADRDPRDPAVLLGGPITQASAAAATPFVDVVLHGEAEELLPRLIARLVEARGEKPAWLDALRHEPVTLAGEPVLADPPLQRCPDSRLPATAAWVSPRSSFGELFLVEAARGCNRGCAYCVMNRGTSGGLRPVPADRILAAIPDWARRVGLVGAAVTDHPELPALLAALVARGMEVGLSSLRADQLDEGLLELLCRAGLRSLTTAVDGLSQRLRREVRRGTTAADVVRAAQLARAHGLLKFKLYLMIGLPDETEADLQEGLELCQELSRLQQLTLTVSPFVAKARTPLAGAPFAGVRALDARLKALTRGLRGRARLQSVSPRWAWVEYQLANGGAAAGLAALQAVRQGGSLAAWEAALRTVRLLPEQV